MRHIVEVVHLDNAGHFNIKDPVVYLKSPVRDFGVLAMKLN